MFGCCVSHREHKLKNNKSEKGKGETCHRFDRQRWILLIGLGVPVAVIVNVLRVATLGVLSLWDPGFSSGQFHTFIGFVWLVPAFMCFLGLRNLGSRLVIEVPAETKKPVKKDQESSS